MHLRATRIRWLFGTLSGLLQASQNQPLVSQLNLWHQLKSVLKAVQNCAKAETSDKPYNSAPYHYTLYTKHCLNRKISALSKRYAFKMATNA